MYHAQMFFAEFDEYILVGVVVMMGVQNKELHFVVIDHQLIG